MIEEQDLVDLAGPAAFERGMDYYRRGRVKLRDCGAGGFKATARGTARYELRLSAEPGELGWYCSCPAAADGAFCKHLVAGALAWLEQSRDDRAATDDAGLRGLLERESPKVLADWLHEAMLDNPALARRFELAHSTGDADALKKAITSVLAVPGFVDYRETMELAGEIDPIVDALRELRSIQPRECLDLCEYTLRRLLGTLERCDDSAGALGMVLEDLAGLHARAARAARPDRRALARSLVELKRLEDWDLFPLKSYWRTLGREGRAAYAEAVRQEFDALPPAGGDRWGEEFHVLQRREELARMERDFDGLMAVLSRHVSSGYDYERLVKACHDFGREAEALSWAERALAEHRERPGVRELAAAELRRVGRRDEALALLWEDFQARPDTESWRRLKKAAGRRWPEYRVRALAAVADAERPVEDGRADVTLRVQLLWADRDREAARALARRQWVNEHLLRSLGERNARSHPADAADFLRRAVDAELVHADARTYADIVPVMRRIWRLAAGEEMAEWLAGIRQRYRARRKLMRLMDEAGLPRAEGG